jgi:hypothetical protein
MNNTGRLTFHLPEDCLTFTSLRLDSTSIVNSVDTRVTEGSLHTIITTRDLYNHVNDISDCTNTARIPACDKFSSMACNNFGIRITWLEESTGDIMRQVLNIVYAFQSRDLLYYCGPTSYQGIIREYLIERYNFTPDIGYQTLRLDATDLLQIADRLKHSMLNDSIDRLLLKHIISIKRVVRRMPQLPDLKAFYWESEHYESF